MKAGTPHMVYGIENAIIHGGHYYTTANLHESAQSLMHTFILDKFLTNINHSPSRSILRRMLMFFYEGIVEGDVDNKGKDRTEFVSTTPHLFHIKDPEYHHLPDVSEMDGLINLLSLCNLVILGNVLDFRTYSAPNQGENDSLTGIQKELMEKYDRNNIPRDERRAICYARGIAFEIFKWIRVNLNIIDPLGHSVKDLPSQFLVKQLRTLLQYKTNAVAAELPGVPHCTISFLQRQIDNVVKSNELIHKEWKKQARDPINSSLAFGKTQGYMLTMNDTPEISKVL